MKVHQAALLLLNVAMVPLLSASAGPVTIGYMGRISGNGQPLKGSQYFKFALIQADGRAVWNSDREGAASADTPLDAHALQVTNGVYRLALGEVAAGMRELDRSLIEQKAGLRLRVWVADPSGWQQLIPDQPLVFDAVPEQNNSVQTGSSGDAIMAELRLLRERVTQLERAAASPKPTRDSEVASVVSLRLPPGLEGEKVLGAANAPLVLLEYTDYQCPFCQRFYQTTFSQLNSNFIDTGRIRFVSRNLPLPGHHQSKPAALATFCAADQEKYWEMRNEILRSSEPLSAPTFQKWARDLGLNLPRFESCLANPDSAHTLTQQIADAAAVGITGTPTFILGRLDADGTLRGELLIGAKPYAEFQHRIESMLSDTK